MNDPTTPVTVRHYCQGIGDCHLLRFARPEGGAFWMLIDCGVHSAIKGGSAMIDRVVADIAAQTTHLDVVVVTHEHTDHLSGFLTAAEGFKAITVDEVWMAWTEDPKDTQAQQLDRHRQQALDALQMASQHLDSVAQPGEYMAGLRAGLDGLLGFSFGAQGDRVRASRDAAAALARTRVRYVQPSDPPIPLAGVPGVRVYPLGPPRDAALLGLTDSASEMYGAAGTGTGTGTGPGLAGARALSAALGSQADVTGDDEAPFDANIGTDLGRLAASGAIAPPGDVPTAIAAFARDHYFGPIPSAGPPRGRGRKTDRRVQDQSWRRIDHDWLGLSADLAMQLDEQTNNTSLVLGFEFIDTRRVLLFAGDAQVGNWLSWQTTRWTVDGVDVTGPDLLARVVYYKVGHHGSHNATLKRKGLDLMTSPDLSAFIPTNEQDAKKIGWRNMPFGPILTALEERCAGRVIRADDPFLAGTASTRGLQVPSGSIRAMRYQTGLWVELDLA